MDVNKLLHNELNALFDAPIKFPNTSGPNTNEVDTELPPAPSFNELFCIGSDVWDRYGVVGSFKPSVLFYIFLFLFLLLFKINI